MTITSPESYEQAGTMKVQCRQMRQKISAFFRGSAKDPGPLTLAHGAWKSLCDKERQALADIEKAERILEQKIRQARLEDGARRAAEDRAANDAARIRAEGERIQNAVKLAAAGDPAFLSAADDLLDMPIDHAPVYVASELPRVEGLQFRKQTVVDVVDARAMFLAAAATELREIAIESGNFAVVAWLAQFVPQRRSVLVPVRRDKENAIEGCGVYDVNRSWLRTEVKQQGEMFKWPGVVVSEREDPV